jgi:hypothetical protein
MAPGLRGEFRGCPSKAPAESGRTEEWQNLVGTVGPLVRHAKPFLEA